MHVSQRFLGAVLASLVQVMAVGCDAERDDDDMTAVDDDDGDDDENDDDSEDDDGDDGGDTSDDKGDRIKTDSPSSPSKNPGYSPCGNGVVDAGEECDDGWFNDANRECTDACRANECNLDENGNCTDAMWPALDFDLYPCTPGATGDECDSQSFAPG